MCRRGRVPLSEEAIETGQNPSPAVGISHTLPRPSPAWLLTAVLNSVMHGPPPPICGCFR